MYFRLNFRLFMRGFKYLCCSIFFLLNFAEVRASVIQVSKVENIDSLLIWAANPKIEKNLRLKFAYTALKVLKTKPTYGGFTNNCIQLSNVFLALSSDNEYLEVADLLLKKSAEINDDEGTVWGNFLKGTYYYKATEHDSSFYYLSKAEKGNFMPDYRFLSGFVLFTKAEILNLKKDYVNSEINSIKALKIAIDERNSVLKYNCYLSLGNALLGLKDKEKALLHYKKANEIADELINEPHYLPFKAQAYNFITTVYLEKKDYKNALKYAEEALSFKGLKEINIEIFCYLKKKRSLCKFQIK